MMLKFNFLFYFQHQHCISVASVSFSDDVSDELTPEKQPRKRAPPKFPNPPAFSSSRSCQPKNSSRSNLIPQSTVQENDTLSSSIQNSSMDSSSGSHLSGNPRNPHYRPPSCAWENTSCSSESILPESVESSELNKTGTLPPHKLAYNQLKPNFMSRHACLDIKSRM